MNDIVAALEGSPLLQASISGYTDVLGNPAYNLDLSRRRAKAVADYLISQGIAADRLHIEGKGMYAAADAHPSRTNRRVEITLTTTAD